jgi:hypothetical protein
MTEHTVRIILPFNLKDAPRLLASRVIASGYRPIESHPAKQVFEYGTLSAKLLSVRSKIT